MKLKMNDYYIGYKGIALDKFNVNMLNNLKLFMIRNINEIQKEASNFTSPSSYVDGTTLEEVKKQTIEFYKKYFSIHDINYPSEELYTREFIEQLSASKDSKEFYDKVSTILKPISPFALPIELIHGQPLVGVVEKKLVGVPGSFDNNRPIYFNCIKIGNQLCNLSPSCLTHEIAHTQTESNLGYTDDLLNKEIISIFLEKMSALESDSSGINLRKVEKIRSMDLIQRYLDLIQNPNITEIDLISNLTYIKSTLFANKLFDMYQFERKQKNRDIYIDDIQRLFDGSIKVEDIIRKNNITINNAQDLSVLQIHL